MTIVKKHTFNGLPYLVEYVEIIEGVTDTLDDAKPLRMTLLLGNDFHAFHGAFHEALEASGFCDKCLHCKDGNPRTVDAARFLWRLRDRWKPPG